MSAVAELKKEIAAREQELARLRAALDILSGGDGRGRGPKPAQAPAVRKRKPKTAEQRALLSELAKARHAKRRAEGAPAAAGGRAKKS